MDPTMKAGFDAVTDSILESIKDSVAAAVMTALRDTNNKLDGFLSWKPGLAAPPATVPISEVSLAVAPASLSDIISVAPSTCSMKCLEPMAGLFDKAHEATADVMEHKDAHESAIPLTVNPSTWYDYFSCAFLDASHCPEYFVNGVHMHVSAICSVRRLLLIGSITSVPFLKLAKFFVRPKKRHGELLYTSGLYLAKFSGMFREFLQGCESFQGTNAWYINYPLRPWLPFECNQDGMPSVSHMIQSWLSLSARPKLCAHSLGNKHMVSVKLWAHPSGDPICKLLSLGYQDFSLFLAFHLFDTAAGHVAHMMLQSDRVEIYQLITQPGKCLSLFLQTKPSLLSILTQIDTVVEEKGVHPSGGVITLNSKTLQIQTPDGAKQLPGHISANLQCSAISANELSNLCRQGSATHLIHVYALDSEVCIEEIIPEAVQTVLSQFTDIFVEALFRCLHKPQPTTQVSADYPTDRDVPLFFGMYPSISAATVQTVISDFHKGITNGFSGPQLAWSTTSATMPPPLLWASGSSSAHASSKTRPIPWPSFVVLPGGVHLTEPKPTLQGTSGEFSFVVAVMQHFLDNQSWVSPLHICFQYELDREDNVTSVQHNDQEEQFNTLGVSLHVSEKNLKKPCAESKYAIVSGLISRGTSHFKLWHIPCFSFVFLELTNEGLALFQREMAWQQNGECFDVSSAAQFSILDVKYRHYLGVHHGHRNIFEKCSSACYATMLLQSWNFGHLNSCVWYDALHCTTASSVQICALIYGSQCTACGIISGAFLKCNHYICCWYALKSWSPLVHMVYTYWLLQKQGSIGVAVLDTQCLRYMILVRLAVATYLMVKPMELFPGDVASRRYGCAKFQCIISYMPYYQNCSHMRSQGTQDYCFHVIKLSWELILFVVPTSPGNTVSNQKVKIGLLLHLKQLLRRSLFELVFIIRIAAPWNPFEHNSAKSPFSHSAGSQVSNFSR